MPWSSLTDLVTHGDAMVLVEITGETAHEESSPGPEITWIGRGLDARVREVLWQNPHRPAPPDLLSLSAEGWTTKNGGERRRMQTDAVWPEVGEQYVTVVGYFQNIGKPAVIDRLAPEATWMVESGRLDAGCVDTGPTGELDGLTIEDATQKVAERPIPEAVLPYMDLPIFDRVLAIQALESSGTTN